MRFCRIAVVVLSALVSTASLTQAQLQPHGWTPRSVEALGQSASSKTEFTLDHSMLVLASRLDPENEDLRRVIAGVSGVSVHNYRFARPWMYDPEILSSLKEEYRAAGWKQMVNSEKDGGTGATDVWMRFENNAISHVAILVARASEVDFFVVSGSISPLDLSHLGGHFGIPKIEGGVMVPNTSR